MIVQSSRRWIRAAVIVVPVTFLLALLFTWLGSSTPGKWARRLGVAQPNIIIFMIDTLRADELGVYGAAVTETPAMDTFAASAAVFENARSPAVSTRPAVASFLTGLSPFMHGMVENQGKLPADFTLLPELLARQGYHTGALVANPNIREQLGFGRGFEEFKSLLPASWVWAADADWVIGEVRQFVENAPGDRPFFLFVLSIDPHQPYQPPAPFDAMYDPEAARIDAGSGDNLRRIDALFAAGSPVPQSELDQLRALYRGEISFADAAFGDLLDFLKQKRIFDDTLIVLTSDHGEAFGEHGNRGHSKTLFDETLRIPLIARHPGIFDPGRHVENVDLLDLSTTIAAVAGAPRPAYWYGRDLRDAPSDSGIFAANLQRRGNDFDIFTAVTRGNFKLIRNESGLALDLFDLDQDQQEQKPLDRAEHMDKVLELSGELRRFREQSLAWREEIMREGVDVAEDELSEQMRRRLEALGYVE